jgi:hypothetical protein
VTLCYELVNHRDTEDTEVAQRNPVLNFRIIEYLG